MDPAYEKYDKTTNKSFEDMRNSIINQYDVHDNGHNIKNAEATLERGSHFDGEHTYGSTDLAVLLLTLESQRNGNFIGAVSHKSILQFDKQSDELSLQRLSGNVLQVCTKTGSLLKTDVPENRCPWFAESHDAIGKSLFVTVSFSGIVLTTDGLSKNVFYYTQTSLPCKDFFGRKRDVISNHCKG